jgi:hypothetical protein
MRRLREKKKLDVDEPDVKKAQQWPYAKRRSSVSSGEFFEGSSCCEDSLSFSNTDNETLETMGSSSRSLEILDSPGSPYRSPQIRERKPKVEISVDFSSAFESKNTSSTTSPNRMPRRKCSITEVFPGIPEDDVADFAAEGDDPASVLRRLLAQADDEFEDSDSTIYQAIEDLLAQEDDEEDYKEIPRRSLTNSIYSTATPLSIFDDDSCSDNSDSEEGALDGVVFVDDSEESEGLDEVPFSPIGRSPYAQQRRRSSDGLSPNTKMAAWTEFQELSVCDDSSSSSLGSPRKTSPLSVVSTKSLKHLPVTPLAFGKME